MANWVEDEWERLTDYVRLDVAGVSQLLCRPVERVELLAGGKANTNYKVAVDGGVAVLRLYERDRDSAARERLLLPLVGAAIPVPAAQQWGETAAGTPFGLFEFIEGVHPHQAMEPETARILGTSLGNALRALESVAPPCGPELGLFAPDLTLERTFASVADSFVDLISWSLDQGRARKRLNGPLRASLAATLDEAARRLEAVDSWRGLVHGDYKSSNLLVQDGQLTGVLDWEFACVFTPLLDVAILMRHRDDFPPAFVAGFAEGHAGLPDDWQELTRVIDLMNLVGFLNASGERPLLYASVERRIAVTVDQLTRRRGS